MQNTKSIWKTAALALLGASVLAVLGVLVWQGITSAGNPDPEAANLSRGSVILNTGLLVFREGLEAILVMAALTASLMGANASYRRPIAIGAGLAFLASVVTWFVAIALLDKVNAPQLHIQAATGLLAIVVLLVIMNWFFHKVYWTGWISHHNKRRRDLMAQQDGQARSQTMSGLVLLGFSAMYREGFEVVLFLQNLRLRAGEGVVLQGVSVGLFFTLIVGVLTFVLHHRLPYKKMLVLTGVLLGGVLIVMVGEQAQEMQLAGWISTTTLPLPIPAWMGMWFAVFPTLESLLAQGMAGLLVIGSYFAAEYLRVRKPRQNGEVPAMRAQSAPQSVGQELTHQN